MPFEVVCHVHVFVDMHFPSKHGHEDVDMAHDFAKGHHYPAGD
jgi:hypothetical protein